MSPSEPDFYGQGAYAVRLDWGPVGALAGAADATVVVDVLSFSTAVTIAVQRGTTVYPCPWRDERATILAAQHEAVVAVGRLEAARAKGPGHPSLSPAGLLTSDPVPRLVLPSPNGSTIVTALQEVGAQVAIGCLRNAEAAASWMRTRLAAGQSLSLVAAGERWAADDSLRPALEDLLGAGAILAALLRLSPERAEQLSPEALVAATAFETHRDDLGRLLRDCVGGRELTERGFAADVEVAAELNASQVVPVLVDGAFRPSA